MTREQEQQIWEALWKGKHSALQLYGLTKHIEGSREWLAVVEGEVNAAMDLVSQIREAQEDKT